MKSVLITGGTGTLGAALVERLLADGQVRRICVFSRGEHRQAEMRQWADSEKIRFMIGDVRDKDRVRYAARGCDTVIHAAALKRIEVGQYNPTEMVRTNVDGTINTVEVAVDEKVDSFVLVSSDKAYQPISPYGHSKAMAEQIVLNANYMHGQRGPKFSVVRYGNVWKSQGSVVPSWVNMGPLVPITDPDCTRFFMRKEEAVQFVLDAIGKPGLHIPDWLPAYRLGDLAEAMNLTTRVVGLPEHEKKNESMRDGLSSDLARRMTVEELRKELNA